MTATVVFASSALLAFLYTVVDGVTWWKVALLSTGGSVVLAWPAAWLAFHLPIVVIKVITLAAVAGCIFAVASRPEQPR